jgi:hypothetical protein
MTIFIVTFARDFAYLRLFLKSLQKFASGFEELVILVPVPDWHELDLIMRDAGPLPCSFRTLGADEWPGKGMMWHEAQIMLGNEWCPGAKLIAHTDSDTIFTRPCTPDDFKSGGKPLLRYESFKTIGARHHGVMEWQRVTELCLPIPVPNETMRNHMAVHIPETYIKARQLIEEKTKQPWAEYVRGCKNDFPNGFCEFVTLGTVAMHFFPDRYALSDAGKQTNPDFCPLPIGQFWSHRPPDQMQEIWWDGVGQKIVPVNKCRELGIL